MSSSNFETTCLFIFLYLGIITIGVCYLRSNIFIVCQPSCRFSKKIVLTIDDGHDVRFTIPLLELLKKYNILATFFLVGKEAEKYPGLVKKILQESHTIASHGYSHAPWSNFYLSSHWEEDFHKTEKILGDCLKQKWFRPPFTLLSPHLAYVVEKLEYTIIAFHIRALDFGNRRIHNLSNRLCKKLSKGGIVMIHGAISSKASELQREEILKELDKFFQKIMLSGCEILTLEEYLNLQKK